MTDREAWMDDVIEAEREQGLPSKIKNEPDKISAEEVQRIVAFYKTAKAGHARELSAYAPGFCSSCSESGRACSRHTLTLMYDQKRGD